MKTSEIIEIIRETIRNGLIQAGYQYINIVQAFQPTMEGISSSPTVYFFQSKGKRYGFSGYKYVWDEEKLTYYKTQTNQIETKWQIQALVEEIPENPDFYTAYDLVNEVAWVLQSDATIKKLVDLKIGIYRITDIINPYFINDRDQNSSNPSFEFTLNYTEERTSIINKITPPAIITVVPV